MASYPILNIYTLNDFIDASTYASQLSNVYINNSLQPTQSSPSSPWPYQMQLCWNSSNISTFGEENLFKHTVPVLSSYTSSLKSIYVDWPSDSKILATTNDLKYKDLTIATETYINANSALSSPLNIYCKYPLYQNISGYVSSIISYFPNSCFTYGTYGNTISYLLNGSSITLPGGIFSFPPAYNEAQLCANAPNSRSWEGLSPTSYLDVFNDYKFLLLEINFYSAWINDSLGGANSPSLPANNYSSFDWSDVLNLSNPSRISTAIGNGINSFKSKSSSSNNNATVRVYYGNLDNLCESGSASTTWASGIINKKTSVTYWMLPDQPYLYSGTVNIPSQNGQLEYDWGLSGTIAEHNIWSYLGNDPQNSAINYILNGFTSAGLGTAMKNNIVVFNEVYLLSSSDLATSDLRILFESADGDTDTYDVDGLFPFIVRSFILIGTDITINKDNFNQPLWGENYYPWGIRFDINDINLSYSKYFMASGSGGSSGMFDEMNVCCPNYKLSTNLLSMQYFQSGYFSLFANAWTPN